VENRHLAEPAFDEDESRDGATGRLSGGGSYRAVVSSPRVAAMCLAVST
jgi:hypothetical protein